MKPFTTSLLAFCLLFIGIVAVSLIVTLLGRGKQVKHPKFFRWAHRIAGYLFVILYLFICANMLNKLSRDSVSLSTKDAIHAYIGFGIFSLLIVKICIVRLFKKYYQSLVVYGTMIAIAVYSAVAMSAGYYVISLIGSQYIKLKYEGQIVKVNVNAGRNVVRQKCASCHSLERVYSHHKTAAGWRDYVSRMRAKDPANMSKLEALQAVGYLVKTLGIDATEMNVQIGLKIILSKCDKCHTIERIFKSRKTGEEWTKTLEKMRSFDPQLLNDSEARQVHYYLSTTLERQNTDG